VKPLDRQHVRRICLRTTNWIGDAVMTTPAMGALRCSFPEAEIVVVANPLVAELFRYHPYCDRVIVYDKKGAHRGVSGFLRFCRMLRRERFDLAVLLQNAIEAAFVALLAGIPRRVGYGTDGRSLLLTHAVTVGEAQRRLHHTRYYLKMLEALGVHGGDGLLRLACTDEELFRAGALLGEGFPVAINPGAAYGSAKRWLPERFAEVGNRLHAEYGARIVLTGGPGEMQIGEDIAAAMRVAPLNLIGKTSVREMMAILSLCRLVVTNDSGPMHVAAAFGTPIVAVFGSTDHSTTSPLADTCRIIRKEVDCAPCLLRQCPTDHRCMEAIGVEDVMDGVRELLGDVR